MCKVLPCDLEVCIYQPSPQRQFLKGSLTGLNTQYFFSDIGCQTNVKEEKE